MQLSKETPQDLAAIRKVNEDAFDTSAEAKIVGKLRNSGDLVLSLVASDEDAIVGHIAFSKMWLPNAPEHIKLIGLGPMAVKSSHQRRGIGSKLAREGLKTLKEKGISAVFVLGHPDYYPKFGFQPSRSTFDIWSKYEVPDNVFLGVELQEGALRGLNGLITYSSAFD